MTESDDTIRVAMTVGVRVFARVRVAVKVPREQAEAYAKGELMADQLDAEVVAVLGLSAEATPSDVNEYLANEDPAEQANALSESKAEIRQALEGAGS